MRVLGHGVDTFVINLYWPVGAYRLPDGLEAKLDALKDAYRHDPDNATFWGVDAYIPLPRPDLGEALFESAIVQSARHYAWQLSFGNLVFVRLSSVKDTTQRESFPAMRVEFTGTYMHYVGRDVEKVVSWVLDAAEHLTGTRPHRVQVSRADLFVDVEADPFRLTDLDRFTSRSRVKGIYAIGVAPGREAGATRSGGAMSNTPPATQVKVPDSLAEGVEVAAGYLHGREWTGFTFGRGPLMARVYSKTVEARFKPQAAALLKSYEEEHGPIGHVIRVEFQLTTEALAQMLVDGDGVDLRDWDAFRLAIPSLWAYLTEEWLVLRDATRVNAFSQIWNVPVDPLWRLVQGAFNGDKRALVRGKFFMGADPVLLARQALGTFMKALAAVGRIGQVDMRSWWVGVFRALGRNEEERAWLAREASLAYDRLQLRQMAAIGIMPEKWRYGGVGG